MPKKTYNKKRTYKRKRKTSLKTRLKKFFQNLKKLVLIIIAIIGVIFGPEVLVDYGILDPDDLPNKSIIDLAFSENYSESTVKADPDSIPEYSGEDYIVLNENVPNFNDYDIENISGEQYSELDPLGRCGTAVANLHHSMMPTEERGSIGQVKPSGWKQEKYAGVVDSNPPYLYNRCHLIAFALTGQNANELNLITGTRYMNVESMLPWETKVMKYLDDSDNHVMYRVTPYFKGNELVARGVELEAYSVEDNGEGVSFHVFVYNVQPGVEIDYLTGESKVK